MIDRWIVANRLRHHLLEWGAGERTVLLLHGIHEHAHAWDYVAPTLAAAGWHVWALDWRGHGDSEWVGAGGYYHFADYTADLAFLVRALGGRVALVGHSMGGNAAIVYAGTEPDRVAACVAVDAVGPYGSPFEIAPDRYRSWIQDLARIDARAGKAVVRGGDAVARLRESYPRLSDAAVLHMAEHGARQDGDTLVWKFDALHQSTSPQPYYREQGRAFWHRVTCPMLYIAGEQSPLALPADDLAERLDALRAEKIVLPESGHHPHLECPDALAAILIRFLDRARWC